MNNGTTDTLEDPPTEPDGGLRLRPGRQIFSDAQWKRIGVSLRLSPREFQVVQHVFDDHNEKEIAEALKISAHTVHTHFERLYRKLGLSGRVQLIVHVVSLHLRLEDGILGGRPGGPPRAG